MKVDPRLHGAQCDKCPLAKKGQPNNPVWGEGIADPRYPVQGILVGEGPGNEEIDQGRPFCGKTGRDLDEELIEAGISRSRLYVTNATKCKPPPEKNENMLKQAAECCKPALNYELSQLDPQLPILALGKLAWLSVAGKIPKGGLDEGRGFIRTLPTGRKYIATWHPTFAFYYYPYEWGSLVNDIQKFGRLINGKLRPGPTALITKPTVKDIWGVVREGRVAVDIETGPAVRDMPWTGKDPTRARLRTIGLGNAEWGLSFPAHRGYVAQLNAVADVLKKYVTIWQNGAWFDHRVLRRYRFTINRWEDTRDARKAMVTTSKLGLGYMATLYSDPDPWKQDEEGDAKGLVFTDKVEELCKYNAQDTVEDMRVWEGITSEPEWAEERVRRLYEIHKEMAVVAANMHTRGVLIDQKRRSELDHELLAEAERRRAALVACVGLPDFRGTAGDMRSLLFKRHRTAKLGMFDIQDPVEEVCWTDTGLIKVDQGHLLMLVTSPIVPEKAKEIIRLYWQYNAVVHTRSTYVVSKGIDEALGPDGRLRADWNSCAADTGRWSASHPPLQQLSKDKD